MRNHPLCFLLGFAIGYLPALYILANVVGTPTQVLAEEQTPEPIAVVLETENPEEVAGKKVLSTEETVSATPEPTPEETSTPTPVATESPEPTATPAPTPTPDVYAHPPYDDWIAQYAGQYGIDRNLLDRIAQCESQFNPDIVSPNGKYVGLFQFSIGTWQSVRGPEQMGLDTNPDLRTNAEEAIKTAAYLISKQGTSPWPLCLN
jgi:hypothetical protein